MTFKPNLKHISLTVIIIPTTFFLNGCTPNKATCTDQQDQNGCFALSNTLTNGNCVWSEKSDCANGNCDTKSLCQFVGNNSTDPNSGNGTDNNNDIPCAVFGHSENTCLVSSNNNCVWNYIDNACVTKQTINYKCSDFSNNQTRCELIGTAKVPINLVCDWNSKSSTCVVSDSLECGSIMNEGDCESSGNNCHWKGGECKPVIKPKPPKKKCSSFSTQGDCSGNNDCTWEPASKAKCEFPSALKKQQNQFDITQYVKDLHTDEGQKACENLGGFWYKQCGDHKKVLARNTNTTDAHPWPDNDVPCENQFVPENKSCETSAMFPDNDDHTTSNCCIHKHGDNNKDHYYYILWSDKNKSRHCVDLKKNNQQQYKCMLNIDFQCADEAHWKGTKLEGITTAEQCHGAYTWYPYLHGICNFTPPSGDGKCVDRDGTEGL